MEKEMEQEEKKCTCENGSCRCDTCTEENPPNLESASVDKKDKKKKEKIEEKEKKNKYKKEIEKLEEKVKTLETKVLEEKAELINYQKRKDKEVSSMIKYASEDMIKDILPIVDNFERAIGLDDDNLQDELSKFLEGFKMIYCHLIKVLEENGVKAIDGNNKAFDPTYHDAVMTEEREGIEAGMVLEVLQKGYLFKDKVIRPAMVKVSN